MPQVRVAPHAPHEYDVTVDGDGASTHHRVRVPAELRTDLGLTEDDEPSLVRASFDFLLAREPAEAILREFDLTVIERYFPEYRTEIRGTRSPDVGDASP